MKIFVKQIHNNIIFRIVSEIALMNQRNRFLRSVRFDPCNLKVFVERCLIRTLYINPLNLTIRFFIRTKTIIQHKYPNLSPKPISQKQKFIQNGQLLIVNYIPITSNFDLMSTFLKQTFSPLMKTMPQITTQAKAGKILYRRR